MWLHPAHFEHGQADLRRAYDCQAEDPGVAVMMLHSSELMPGGSRRTPTRESALAVLHRLDLFLTHVASKGDVRMTLSGAAMELRSHNRLEVRHL